MPRVLIADDEESMRTLVARAVAMDGHDIVTAEDGAEALEILSQQPGAFDLLLTDIKMPIMDGIALALAAARDFPDLTILLMTGFADQRERAHGLSAIVHDVVTKPFSVADIRTAVAAALAAFGQSAREAIATTAAIGDADTSDLFTEISRGVDHQLWFVESHAAPQ